MAEGVRLPRKLLIVDLRGRFRRLNPEADPEEVAWEDTIDEKLGYEENLLNLQATYPRFEMVQEPRRAQEHTW